MWLAIAVHFLSAKMVDNTMLCTTTRLPDATVAVCALVSSSGERLGLESARMPATAAGEVQVADIVAVHAMLSHKLWMSVANRGDGA